MREYIDGQAFKDMVLYAAAALEAHKQIINELNVFPVPDGDTGTNMSLTLNAAASELSKTTLLTVGKAAEITAAALLRGARGNSGVILSLLFRGIARSLKDQKEAGAAALSEAMLEGVSAAYKAVMKPAEGTILTVSRISAERAKTVAAEGAGVELMLSSCIKAAKEALANTINLNPVLKKAGVIDAGGKGYVIILEAMLAALRGEKIYDSGAIPEMREKADFSDFDTGDITFTYCTEFIVERENTKDPLLLRDFLGDMGDSVVVVDDDEIIKVHVHTNTPGAALTEALSYGCLLSTKIENMRKQHTETVSREQEQATAIASPEKKFGIVSVCAGSGMESVFRDLGVDGLVSGGQTMNPSTEDILKQINKTPAEVVFVLPNNKNIIMSAEQCASLTDKKVVVIPSLTIPQGIAALLAFEPSLDEETLKSNMESALTRVHTFQVTYAARNSEYDGHEINEGDFLALLEGKLIAIDRDINVVLSIIGDKLSDMSPEFVTVFYGIDVEGDIAEECTSMFDQKLPGAEITLVSGGQPVYNYIISAE